MLLNLHVKNFAIIDEIEVNFKDGLNILSGETGAGKSIIIGSINVAIGDKVSKDIIRKGADYALVELFFQTDDKKILNIIKGFDIPVDDGEIIISRKIMNRRSISRINGETVPIRILKEISSLLIDIHGQHEHQSLLYKEKHLEIVDQYGKEEIEEIKTELEQVFKEYASKKRKLAELKIDDDKRLREISFLEYEINEIQSANLKTGEDELLTTEYKKLSNIRTISESLGAAYDLLSYQVNNSAGNYIGRAVKHIAKIEEFDEYIHNLLSQIQDIESLVNDFNRELSDYLAGINNNDNELESIEKRLDLINHLKAKYGNHIDEIMKYCWEQEQKLEEYNNYENIIIELTKDIQKIEKTLHSLSERLSILRQEKGKELSQKMKKSLIDLNFSDIKFEIKFHRLNGYHNNGFDDAEILISTNPGEELKPLSQVASGGELSRIMLAIKTVLADKDEIYSLIFDEIDVGISGRTAQKVSEKLSTIANNHQVLCITHLPQIAAMADTHYIIEKISDGITTHTSIRQLIEEESIEEIARILGGAKITDTVISSAKEMKTLANKTKKS